MRLRTFGASGLFGYFFWLLKRSNWIEGIQDKNHQADAARDDGAQRAFDCRIITRERLTLTIKRKPGH
ncbi:MAG: hypothetical protein ACJASL_004567 [Paraglaciecola sp.]